MTNYFFNAFDKAKNIYQPILQRSRQTYRGNRDSHKENLEQNQFLLDIERLNKRIESVDGIIKTMSSSFYFHSAATPVTVSATPFFDARSKFYGEQEKRILVDDTVELGSLMFRLSNKIKRLENQEK